VNAWYWLLLGVLATWRVTHLLHVEDGPWRSIANVRDAIRRLVPGLVECFYCLSIWVAAPIAYVLGDGMFHRLLLIPALSGGAILIERLTQQGVPAFVEDVPVDPSP
jgi:Protein of unknown function (DUF1360)